MFIVLLHFVVSFSQFHRAQVRGGLSVRKSGSHMCGGHFPGENRARTCAEGTFRRKIGPAHVRGVFAGPIHDLAHVRAVLSRLGGLLARWRVVLAFLFLLEVVVRLPKVVMYS